MKPKIFETERIIMYCLISQKGKTAVDNNGLKCRNDMICTEVYSAKIKTIFSKL